MLTIRTNKQMKMSPAHFARLEIAIHKVCRNTMWPEQYAEKTGHGTKRVLWDYFANAMQYDGELYNELCAYLYDIHIETALGKIIKTHA